MDFDHLTSRFGYRQELSLVPFCNCLLDLGNPQKDLKGIIHIAGTNGKGSTLSNLEALLQQKGKTVNRFSSPHLISPTERIRHQGQQVSIEWLEKTLAHYQSLFLKHQLSYFEVLTALAFLYFQEKPADYTLLEVGLGGRFDATNVIQEPIACVITAIGLDHQDRLGYSLAAIAGEKAGIIKKGTPVFSAPQTVEVREVLQRVSCEKQALLRFLQQDESLQIEAHRVTQNSMAEQQIDQAQGQSIKGVFAENAALARLCFQELFKEDPDISILKYIKNPGRFEALGCVGQAQVYFDVAHNEPALEALMHLIQEKAQEREGQKVALIFALPSTKHLESCLKVIDQGHIDAFFWLEKREKFHKAQDLKQILGKGENVTSIKSALEQIRAYSDLKVSNRTPKKSIGGRDHGGFELIIIAGSHSLYQEAIGAVDALGPKTEKIS